MTTQNKSKLELPIRPRTSEGMRDTLFDALESMNKGVMTAQEAHAVCKIAAQIINSVNTEIEFYKHIGRLSKGGAAAPSTTLTLGAPGDGSAEQPTQ